jgi:hypothetical protein
MTDSVWQRIGGTKLPVEAADIDATALTFEALDPARESLAALFAAAIRAELGTGADSAWGLVCASLPSGAPLRASTNPIGSVLKLEPSARVMRELRAAPPVLAVHRTGEVEYSDVSTEKTFRIQKWHAHWIAGPLTVGELHKLHDATLAVSATIQRTIMRRGHPAYQSGAVQFGSDTSYLASVRMLSHEAGQAQFAEGEEAPLYLAVRCVLETHERTRDLDEGGELLGLTLTADVGDAVELVPGLVVGLSEFYDG